MTDFALAPLELDLPPLAGGFARRLHDAGLPAGPERAARFARALTLVADRAGIASRRRLYWTARAVFLSDPGQVRAFDAVFAEVFGSAAAAASPDTAPETGEPVSTPEDERPVVDSPLARDAEAASRFAAGPRPAPPPGPQDDGEERPVPVLASADEVLRAKRFEALEPDELAAVYRLMARLVLATPWRRTRRRERGRHGESVDMRRTLRGSLRTGGDPTRLSRRRRRVVRRRLVLLCDISGSMEPYARAYLQFLACAAIGPHPPGHAEAFVFATRLTRLTRALHSRHPERAIQRAAATAPDWSSGTRIGDALKAFNDRHGRRGMARGAVVVILSDGWERGDPAVVGREMERLARLAHRIVWVNPRVAASGFVPRAAGMAAALPHCDELVSGHSLAALEEVVDAIAGDRPPVTPVPEAPPEPTEDSWASATPVPGSSVAMPSGYGPSRGKTTPGWAGVADATPDELARRRTPGDRG